MNIKNCERKEKGEAVVTIEINSDEFESAIIKAFNKNRNRISVPGFRKGKVPWTMVKKLYGAATFHAEALELIYPEALKFVVAETGQDLVGHPELTDVDMKDDGSVDVTINVIFYPDVKLGGYKGLSVAKNVVEVPEDEIDAEVEGMRERNARIEKADRPAAKGDIAIIDYQGFVDGEPFMGGQSDNFEIAIGSGKLIPGFEDSLIGMEVGEERDINLTFPDDYHEHLAGAPVLFKVKLNELREKILPELDDEFAVDVSEFDTLDEYRADIGKRLGKAKQDAADEAYENDLIDMVVGSMEAEVPEFMIAEQNEIAFSRVKRQISAYGMDPDEYFKTSGITPEEFKDSTRADSEHQVRIWLALEKIAELEGIEASPEDIENEYVKIAASAGIDIEKLKETVSQEKMTEELKLRYAKKFLVDNAAGNETGDATEGAVDNAADDATDDETDNETGDATVGAVDNAVDDATDIETDNATGDASTDGAT